MVAELTTRWMVVLLLAIALSGCMDRQIRQADIEMQSGDYKTGLERLQALHSRNPNSVKAKTAYYVRRESLLSGLLQQAEAKATAGDVAGALTSYGDVLDLVPDEPRATKGLQALEKLENHKRWDEEASTAIARNDYSTAMRLWRDILVENPGNSDVRKKLLKALERQQKALRVPPTMSKRLSAPVSLEFRQVSLQTILEILSQTSGLNFLLDPDLKGQEKVTLFAKNTTAEDGLRLLLTTYGLYAKPLNESTVLIYPGTKEKRQKYEDLVIRTFRLEGANPKQMSSLISAFVKSAEIHVDESARTISVRDSMENMLLIERLVRNTDAPDAEVVLEIRIMEVSSDKLVNLGVQYPSKISASVSDSSGAPGVVPLTEIEDLDRGNFLLKFGDPLAVLNFSQTDSSTKTLANPHIRVRNNEKAKVMIGDKVPVITTTNNTTSSVVSESISYLDVGLKLEVEPEIHIDDDVSMTINLEVSDIVKQITTSTGLIAYQIGSRSASTALRLRNGETQALAGLIRNDAKESASRVPGLGSIPLVGRLFSNESNDRLQSELVLMITPHVVRSYPLTQASEAEMMTGSYDRPGSPLRLRSGAEYSATREMTREHEAPAAARPGLPLEVEESIATIQDSVPSSEAIESTLESTSREGFATAGAAAITESSPEDPQDSPAMSVIADPSIAKVRLSLVAPAQIRTGQPFTVAVMGNSQSLVGDLRFVLSLPVEFELVAASPGSGMQLQAKPQNAGVLFTRAPGMNPQQFGGPLMMVTLVSTRPVDKGLLRITDLSAKDENGKGLIVFGGDPRTVTVTK